MKHLSNLELLALAEGSREGGAHLETCGACRSQVEEFRGILASLRDDAVPEPSPLFWSEFSRRVRQGIEKPLAPRSRLLLQFAWWRPAVALGALAVLVLVVLVSRAGMFMGRSGTPQATVVSDALVDGKGTAGTNRPTDDNSAAEAADDGIWDATGESWTFMNDVAMDLDLEDADEAGFLIQPGSAQLAVDGLSQEERREFASLLREELSRPEL